MKSGTLRMMTSMVWLTALASLATETSLRDAFWVREPKSDPATQFIWNFGTADEEILDDFKDTDIEEEPSEPDLLSTGSQAEFKLVGGAKISHDGRFGDGVLFNPKSSLRAEKLVWNFKESLTLDFWVKTPAHSKVAIILTIPMEGGNAPGLQIVRGPDGLFGLRCNGKQLLTHPRSIPLSEWVHLAIVLGQKADPVFHVQGTALPLDATQRAVLMPFFSGAADSFVIGALNHEPGFAGAIDSVRLSNATREFYELEETDLVDTKASRPFTHESPFFIRKAFSVYCSFDHDIKPEIFNGHSKESSGPKKAIVPGLRGNALDLRHADEMDFVLRGHSLLAGKQGTLEVWVRPTGWDNFFASKDYFGKDIPRLPLMRFSHKGAPHYLNYRALVVSQGAKAPDMFSGRRYVRIHPGRWTHLAVTWDGRHQQVFIDGLLQDVGQVSFGWGGHPHIKEALEEWKARSNGKDDGTYELKFPKSATLIDELRIYPYAFHKDEAWNAYARYLPDREKHLKPLPFIETTFDYLAHDWHPGERMDVSVACLPVKEIEPAKATLSLAGADGEMIHSGEIELDANGRGKIRFEGKLVFGTYPVAVESFDVKGNRLHRLETKYNRVRPDWYENTLGEERTVPPPWTPIKIDGNAVSVWGRVVNLAPTGLPESITAVEHPLLAAPASIRGTADGKPFTLKGEGINFTEQADDRIRWQAKATSESISANISTWMEFDGLMYFTVTLKPSAGPVSIENLDVDFPFVTSEATQLICNGGGMNFRASWDIRMIPQGEGSVWNTRTSKPKMQRAFNDGPGNFCPNIWVGGDYCGLNFSGDNDQGWTPDDDSAAQEILRVGDNVVFRMNVISLPVRLEGERTFTFILHPTPTKPLPKGWRGWNRSKPGVPFNAIDVIDVFNGFPLTGEPDKAPSGIEFQIEPKSWEAAAEQRNRLLDKFGKENPVLMYIDYSWPRFGPSIADWNHALHAGTGRLAWTPEVEDYFVYTINEYIKRGLIDGLYIDDVSMGRTYSLACTAYPFPGHKTPRRVGFNSMGFRRFLKRCYRQFVKHGKQPLLLPHMTYCFEIPALSFCAATVNGEARDIHPFSKRDVIDTWGMSELRIQGNAPKWGFGTFWKPTVQLTESAASKTIAGWLHRQSRAMHAAMMPNDLWYLWHYPTGRSVLPSLYEFGMEDPKLEFRPYWRATDFAKVDGEPDERLLLCAWVKQNQAMIMVSNLNKEEKLVTFAVDPNKLFGRTGELAWSDIDCTLKRPLDVTQNANTAEALDPNAAAPALVAGAPDEFTEADLEAELEDKDPAEEEAKRLALKTAGSRVTLVVRGHDYRLLLLQIK